MTPKRFVRKRDKFYEKYFKFYNMVKYPCLFILQLKWLFESFNAFLKEIYKAPLFSISWQHCFANDLNFCFDLGAPGQVILGRFSLIHLHVFEFCHAHELKKIFFSIFL